VAFKPTKCDDTRLMAVYIWLDCEVICDYEKIIMILIYIIHGLLYMTPTLEDCVQVYSDGMLKKL
jgi:CRISPR/Cas system-associated protein Csx1